MAFPGTYNFNYYKGDTFDFVIYPKDSAGNVFDLTGYSAIFTMSTTRGSAGVSNAIICDATISDDYSSILCRISAENGATLNASVAYVYDVEITKVVQENNLPVTYTYTLINGTVSVKEQVSGATLG